jgi:hypothetical protein
MLSYLLLEVDSSLKDSVKDNLSKFEFTIDRVNTSAGRYNIVARVITDNQNRLSEFISEHLNPIKGINNIDVIIV